MPAEIWRARIVRMDDAHVWCNGVFDAAVKGQTQSMSFPQILMAELQHTRDPVPGDTVIAYDDKSFKLDEGAAT